MTRVGVIAIVLGALAIAGVARSGHELPIYPSFYPHEIDIRAVAPEQAADQLRQGKIQAYVGRELSFPATPPAEIGTIESLGSFVVVRVNPDSAYAKDDVSACGVSKAVVRALAGDHDLVPHPYPVTPFHGDYLHHADLAVAARARFADGDAALLADLKIRGSGVLAQRHPTWSADDSEWDAEITEVDAAGIVASALLAVNGWLALCMPGGAAAAWNPIGGMTDPIGRLMGSAVSDPALLPSPYEAGWMLNRISDLPTNWER